MVSPHFGSSTRAPWINGVGGRGEAQAEAKTTPRNRGKVTRPAY
jgi:hypothetical protein